VVPGEEAMVMSMKRALAGLAVAVFVVWRAEAQSLSELLPRLLSESVTMPSTVGNIAGNPHEAHFLPAVAQLRAPYALNGALVTQLSTFPLGSSSGGFTYTLDEKTGIPQRSSGNFGPAFAERALTLGKGKATFGLNYQHVSFDRFEGLDLEGGVRFYLQHNDCCPNQLADGTPNPAAAVTPSTDVNPFFEGDLVRADLSLTATTDTAVLFFNYGLTERLDVGVALPFVRVELDARMTSTLLRLATSASPAIHSFGGASPDTRVATEAGSARGLGDVLLRAKWRAMARPGGGLALSLDVRLPTGDPDDLMGSGATQVKGLLVYSGDYGRFSPHLNLGYTLSTGSLSSLVGSYRLGEEVPTPIAGASGAYQTVFRGQSPTQVLGGSELDLPDEINYTAGFAVTVSPRLTLSADAVGRTLRGVNRFGLVGRSFPFRLATGGPLLMQSFDGITDVTEEDGDLSLLLGVAGAKVNVSRTMLLSANVLFPLGSDGLRPKASLTFGLDYTF
jgi:hypothetical protein